MSEPFFPVFDQYGRQIGTVQRVWLGDELVPLWQALALDGCDLGCHADRHDAHYAITDDWEAGRPRDPLIPSKRFRPILALSTGLEPVYLGR